MVPFGLTNFPTTLMCLMNSDFRMCLDKFVLVSWMTSLSVPIIRKSMKTFKIGTEST